MRTYATIGALRAGETVELEGVLFRQRDGAIEPGDFYVAERNTPAQLLTAREFVIWNGPDLPVSETPTSEGSSWVQPVERAYPYDTGECVRVEMIDA
jgi:hypothetical protein